MQDDTIRSDGLTQASVRGSGSGTGAENVLRGPSPRRTRREALNVVVQALGTDLRHRIMLEFLDCVNLFRLREVSRDERVVNLATKCVWFVFDSYALAIAVPWAVQRQVQTSTHLRGLWVTCPFPLETVFHIKSKEVRTLTLTLDIGVRSGIKGIKEFAKAIKGHEALLSLNISNNCMATREAGKEAGKALANALSANTVLKELDVSSNIWQEDPFRDWNETGDGPGFAKELAIGVRASETLMKFNISNNNLFAAGGKAIAEALAGNQVLAELNIADNHLGLDSNYHIEMSGVVAITDTIRTIRALKKLNISANNLCGYGTKALAEVLKSNQIMTELNISHNDITRRGTELWGVDALADAIPTMGALVKFNISSNRLYEEATKAICEGLKGNNILTELNIASNAWYWPCAKHMARTIPTIGALTSINLADNYLQADSVKHIAEAIKEHGALTSLNVSNNRLEAEGATHMAAALPDCKALSSLDMSANRLEANWDNNKKEWISDLTGIKAVADAIPKCRALVTLNLRRTHIPDEQKANLERICQSKNIDILL